MMKRLVILAWMGLAAVALGCASGGPSVDAGAVADGAGMEDTSAPTVVTDEAADTDTDADADADAVADEDEGDGASSVADDDGGEEEDGAMGSEADDGEAEEGGDEASVASDTGDGEEGEMEGDEGAGAATAAGAGAAPGEDEGAGIAADDGAGGSEEGGEDAGEADVAAADDDANWVLLPLSGSATVEKLADGQHRIRVETQTPSPGWKVKLRPVEGGEGGNVATHGWIELEVVGSPPPPGAGGAGAGSKKETATLKLEIPPNVTLIVYGESDGRKVSLVPAVP